MDGWIVLRLMCFWPGLPNAWIHGNLRALVACICFGWVTSILLLATFVWPEWLSQITYAGLGIASVAAWILGSAHNHWNLTTWLTPPEHDDGGAFQQAQDHYLKGDWFEAEAKLLSIVSENPRDAEAQLLLAGVLRHTGRWQAARRRLDQLEFLQAAANWRFEIQRERALVERGAAEESEAPPATDLPTHGDADSPSENSASPEEENLLRVDAGVEDTEVRDTEVGAVVVEEPVREEPVREEPLREEPLREEPLREEPLREELLRNDTPSQVTDLDDLENHLEPESESLVEAVSETESPRITRTNFPT